MNLIRSHTNQIKPYVVSVFVKNAKTNNSRYHTSYLRLKHTLVLMKGTEVLAH